MAIKAEFNKLFKGVSNEEVEILFQFSEKLKNINALKKKNKFDYKEHSLDIFSDGYRSKIEQKVNKNLSNLFISELINKDWIKINNRTQAKSLIEEICYKRYGVKNKNIRYYRGFKWVDDFYEKRVAYNGEEVYKLYQNFDEKNIEIYCVKSTPEFFISYNVEINTLEYTISRFIDDSSFFTKKVIVEQVSNPVNPIYDLCKESIKEEMESYCKHTVIEDPIISNQKSVDEILIKCLRLKADIENAIIDFVENKSNELNQVKEITKGQINKSKSKENSLVDSSDLKILLNESEQIILKKFDPSYIHKFIKLLNFLDTKKNNIEKIFFEIDKCKTPLKFEKQIELLETAVFNYNAVLYLSINMLQSLKNNELIVYFDIYEKFDEMELFNSKWEKELSKKLDKITDNLANIITGIASLEISMSMNFDKLISSNENNFKSLKSSIDVNLKKIKSSIDFNSLINLVHTYQLNKIKK